MKWKLLFAALLCVSASASQAQQTAASASAAVQTFEGTAQAAAGNSLTFNQPSTVTTRQSGTARAEVENVPALGGLALGGGHPCAWSPATGQIVLLGGGIGAGGMTIDSACLLLIQAAAFGDQRAYKAAQYMIAARDEDACQAMQAMGMVKCGSDEPTFSSKSATPATRPQARPGANFTRCEMDGGKVMLRHRANSSAVQKAVNKAECLAQLGY